MANDYQKIIADKRLEAGKLMTETQLIKCNVAIHVASVASSVCGAIPIPIADAIPISAAQATMVIALGKIFEQKITDSTIKGAIGAAASTLIGKTLVKQIPIIGWMVSAAVAGGVTEAIGWIIAVDMAKLSRKEWERQKNAQDAAAAYAEKEFYKQLYNLHVTDTKGTAAEDFSEDHDNTDNSRYN